MKYDCLSAFLPLKVEIMKYLFPGTRNGDAVSSLEISLKSHRLIFIYLELIGPRNE